jgi:hypothetical protein
MKYYALLLFVLAFGLAFTSCSLPRRSESSIREQLLRDAPQGSSYSTILDYVKKRGWSVVEQPTGLETKNIGVQPNRVVGKRVIKAYLGGYRGISWWVDVNCFWAFDEHDKLIDIFIEKQADAL